MRVVSGEIGALRERVERVERERERVESGEGEGEGRGRGR